MKRKGITPVIAVVLLLLITVGAVAGAWTTYQEIISNQDQRDKLAAQRMASNTDLEFASVYSTQNGAINMTIKNVGQRAVNLSNELDFYVIPPGSQSRLGYSTFTARSPSWDHSYSLNCFEPGEGLLETKQTYTCGTGLNFPNATQSIGLVIDYAAVGSKSWEYSCSPQTSSTITC